MKKAVIITTLSMLVSAVFIPCRPYPLNAQEPDTIVFLTWKPNQPEVWEKLIKEFHHDNPDLRVKVQVGPHSSTEYHAIVTQRLKNRDDSLDLFFMDVTWPPEFANAGWALDLTAWFSEREQQKFLPGPVAANSYEGGIYGVPCYLAAGLFYYRKDLLDKHEFRPPSTWDEMLFQGKRILETEADPLLNIYSGQFKQYEGLVCDMMEFIWSNNGGVFDTGSGGVIINRAESVKAVTFVRDHIIGNAAPRGAISYEEPESLDLFIQGKSVFHRNWPYAWEVANNPEKSKIAGKVGVGRLPSFEGHESASTLGGWQFGINRWSRHHEKAWRFIKHMTSFKSQKILAVEASLAPARKAVYLDRELRAKRPNLTAFLPAFERARPRPLSPVYPMISQELQRFFSRAVSDKGSEIPQLADTAAKRIKKIRDLAESIRK